MMRKKRTNISNPNYGILHHERQVYLCSFFNSGKKSLALHSLKSIEDITYGLYLVGHMLNKNCVLIKGIADFGDREKDDKYHKVCSYASAYFVSQYIKKRL